MKGNELQEERQKYGGLTEEEIEHIVETVTKRAVNNFYSEVGKTVVQRLFWLVGIIIVGLAAYMGFTGKGPPPSVP